MDHFIFKSMSVLLNVSYYAIFPATFAVRTLKITSVAGPSAALLFIGTRIKKCCIETNYLNIRHKAIASK